MPLLQHIHRVMGQIAGSTWPKKASNLLAGLIILFSSTQLGIHFWPESAFVYGARVDYLSPTLYFVDCLIILYLMVNFNQFRTLPAGRQAFAKVYGTFSPIIPLLLVNLLFSQNPWASLVWSFHFILIYTFLNTLQFGTFLFSALFLTLLFQLLLSLAQVSLGHSVQGFMYYLGERMVSVGLPNVAVGSFMGQVVLRAYGTFSHPNILAGYSVVALLITIKLFQQRVVRRSDLVGIPTRSDLAVLVVTVVTTLIVVLSQSRAAALSFFALIIPFSFLKSLRSRLTYFVLLLCATSYVLFTGILSRPLDPSLSERLSLQQVSLKVIRAYPLFGAGANAAVTRYPDLAPNFRLLQPDHNSATLFLSWFGIVGIVCLLYQFRTLHKQVFGTLFPLIPLLLLDHYFLTSPQGLFILLLYLKVLKIAKLRVL